MNHPDAMAKYTHSYNSFRPVVRWQLELGNEVVARIDADEYDFPFTYGLLVDSPTLSGFDVLHRLRGLRKPRAMSNMS